MYCKPEDLPRLLRRLQQHLERYQLILEMPKCATWVPAWHNLSDEQRMAHPLVSSIQQICNVEKYGMLQLGSGTDDCVDVQLGPYSTSTEPTRKRLDKAIALLHILNEIHNTKIEGNSIYPLWLILTRSVAHALDFDARMLNPDAFEPFGKRLTEELLSFAAVLLGHTQEPLPDHVRMQLLLPQPHRTEGAHLLQYTTSPTLRTSEQ